MMVRIGTRTKSSKSRKSGKLLEKMSQDIEIYMLQQKRDFEFFFSLIKMVNDEQTKSLSVFSSTRNMIEEKCYFNSGFF